MDNILSVCMIVKNEEDALDRCLNSIIELADEIIIVDTGSVDRTKEIAMQYTNKVYDFTWSNDFSAARNESLRFATSKWVLVLDADEYVEANDIPVIREFLIKEQPFANTIYGISVFSFLGKSIRTGKITEAAVSRLLPNHFGIKFYRPIHEQLCSNEELPLLTKKAPIKVYHTGYLETTMNKKDKSARNKQIFAQIKGKSGFTAYDYFTIGNEYSVQRDYKKAMYYYEKAYAKSNPHTNWHYILTFELINNYMRADRVFEAWELLEKESRDKKHYPDYYCMQGIIYEYTGFYDLAKEAFKYALEKSEALAATTPVFWLVNPSLALETPLSKLITISKLENHNSEMIIFLTKKIQSDPTDYSSLVQLLELVLLAEGETAVQTFSEVLFPNPHLEQQYLLFKVFLALGRLELARTYYSTITSKEHLSNYDKLRYSLLTGEKQTFAELLEEQRFDYKDKEALHLISLAYLIWGFKTDPSKFDTDTMDISNDIDNSNSGDTDIQPYTGKQFYTELIHNQITPEWIDNNQVRLFELITDLFQMGQYDVFDNYIQKLSHPVIIDLLANYFYSKQMYDIAVSYYTILLESNELSLVSYINLATMHVNDKLFEDSIPFYEAAIKESPQSRQLYVSLLTYCQDRVTKEKYANQLLHHFPHYRKLPFLKTLIQ
ncbi:glycosyltransferase family 2 protein [Paenibacillus sp. PL2-23]|uniref:tetratricopeptide repeat-containing glycosyltransferase family 2 protein n=1 Tax=Paenibacillus sp. PL2-23 TaxID=2100729 RepID=UPI0030F7F8A2